MTLENQSSIEQKWQKKWKEAKAWDTAVDNSKEKFFGNVAYPYANSVMHIGHGRTYTIADVYLRYQRLLGKNVLYPIGYHISGTPVLAVADGIKRGDEKVIAQVKEAISDYVFDEQEQEDLIKTFHDPQHIADFFSNTIEASLDSIGASISYERQFTTGESLYNAFIAWQYSKLKHLGLLKQGKYPILYSAQDENAVGEDDIKDGDIDKVSISEMTYIMAKLESSNEYLVAGTLRPDALFGITNMYVKPDMDLVKLKVNGDIWIVSKASHVKIEHQFDNVEYLSEHKGEEFIGQNVIAPITNKTVPVLSAEFCDENHATGIVFSSPADSVHDYLYLFEHTFPGKTLEEFQDKDPLQLTPITQTFDKKGEEIKYKDNIPAYSKLLQHKIYSTKGNEEKLEEMKKELYKESHFGAVMINCGDEFNKTPLKNNIGFEKTKKKLEELHLGGTLYETSRRAKTRGGDDVIVANLSGQWFLDYSDEEVKSNALKLLESAEFLPHNLKNTQKGYVNWANLRPCARKRGLGTKLPYDESWIIEPLSDSTIYQMLYMIMHILKREQIDSKQLSFEFFDYVYLGNGTLSNVSEITGVKKEIIQECREEVQYWNNVDYRYVGLPHMSNHLNYLIYHYSLIFPKSMWPTTLVVGSMMMKNGEKISKSKGNGTPLFRVKDVYGADLYRLYLITNSNYDVEMDFKDDEVEQVKKKFEKLQEIIQDSIPSPLVEYDSFNDTQKWLIAKFYTRVNTAFGFFNEMKLREAYVQIVYEFMQDLSYVQRRLYSNQANEVVKFISEDLIKVLTPVIPHTCEELWEQMGNSTFVSHESIDLEKKQYFINDEILGKEAIIEQLIKDIATQQELKKGTSLEIVVAPQFRFILFNSIDKMFKTSVSVKEMMQTLQSNFSEDSKFISKFVPKTLKSGLHFYMSQQEEVELIKGAVDFIKEEFNFTRLTVKIFEDTNIDLKQSHMPSKPLIFIS
ncbi:MAG: leucine--tRNA ligase [Candidatus Nanoarchaeia archaeon]